MILSALNKSQVIFFLLQFSSRGIILFKKWICICSLALLLKQAMQDIDFQSLSSLIFPNLESHIEALQGKGNGSFQVTSCRMMADPITRHQGIVAGLPDSKWYSWIMTLCSVTWFQELATGNIFVALFMSVFHSEGRRLKHKRVIDMLLTFILVQYTKTIYFNVATGKSFYFHVIQQPMLFVPLWPLLYSIQYT